MDLKTKASKDWEWFSIDYSAATDGYPGDILVGFFLTYFRISPTHSET